LHDSFPAVCPTPERQSLWNLSPFVGDFVRGKPVPPRRAAAHRNALVFTMPTTAGKLLYVRPDPMFKEAS